MRLLSLVASPACAGAQTLGSTWPDQPLSKSGTVNLGRGLAEAADAEPEVAMFHITLWSCVPRTLNFAPHARSALDDGLIEHDGGDDVAADGGGSSAPPDGGGGDTPAPPSGSVGGREASSAKSTKQQHHKAEVAAEQQGHVESSNSTS